MTDEPFDEENDDDNVPEWPKNDPVPDGGVPLPPDQHTPPVEDDE